MTRSQLQKHTLNILFWNSDGLPKKFDEFSDYLENSDVDIALIQETRFWINKRFNIGNYTLHRKDREHQNRIRNFGGTAIYVKNNIPHYPVNDLIFDKLEANAIMILLENNRKLLIVSAYFRHNIGYPGDDLNKIFNYNNMCIIAGDLNARHRAWGCNSSNVYGREIYNLIDNNNSIKIIAPSTPTHYPKTTAGVPSIIDLALIKEFPYHQNNTVLDLFTSDHKPVFLQFNMDIDLENTPPISEVNWTVYEKWLLNSKLLFPIINSTQDIENATIKLTETIKNALNEATKLKQKPRFHELPSEIKKLIKERNCARLKYQTTRLPADRQNYYYLKAKIIRAIDEYRNDYWANLFSNLDTEDNTLWRFNTIFSRKKVYHLPPIHGLNGMAYDNNSKTEALADNYESQFQINEDVEDEEHDLQVSRVVNRYLRDAPPIIESDCTPTEIVQIIDKLKNKKAPGIDKINNKCLKHLPVNILIFLTALINAIIKFSHFPQSWKTAVICPIPKPDSDLTFPVNYRPISLLCSLSKITERIILNRLQIHIDENNLVMPEQFGFRQKHNTTHQLLRLLEVVTEAFNNKTPVGAVFLDISKAYDKVPHKHLLYKLINMNFPKHLIHLLYSYLKNRKFTVKLQTSQSSDRNIEAGLQQGSILAPTLYSLYTNDCPRTDLTTLLLYADDTGLVATAPHHNSVASFLQHHLDKIEDWCTKWKIKINPEKTQAIYFTRTYKLPPRLYIAGTPINWGPKAKYLGVTLDKRLTWKHHIKTVVDRMTARKILLDPLLKSPHLSIHNKLLLFKTTIMPIALYASPVWAFAATSNIDKIEKFQSKTIREIIRPGRFTSNKTLFRSANMLTFRERVKQLAIKFYDNISNIPNEIIAEIPDYDFRNNEYRRRPRATLLDPG